MLEVTIDVLNLIQHANVGAAENVGTEPSVHPVLMAIGPEYKPRASTFYRTAFSVVSEAPLLRE